MRIWRILIRSLWLCSCLVWSISCTASKVVVLPDSRQLVPAIKCPEGMTCALDPGKITMDRGYLREIMQDLERCGEK